MIESKELSQGVWSVLLQLSPEQRAVIVMKYYLKMSELEITQELKTSKPTINGLPPDAIVKVMIGNNPGAFVRGAVVDGVYDPEFGLTLWWQIGELQISLHFHNSANFPARLEMEDVIAIAESFH